MCVEKHTDRYQCIQRQCDRQRTRLRGVLQTCHYNLSLLFPYVLISEREMRIGLKRRGQRVHLTADLQRLVAPVMKGNAPLLLSGALVQQSVLTHVTASTGRVRWQCLNTKVKQHTFLRCQCCVVQRLSVVYDVGVGRLLSSRERINMLIHFIPMLIVIDV